MKHKITALSFSGWSQNPDSLEIIFRNSDCNIELKSFDYSRFDNIENFYFQIQKLSFIPNLVIGWSLGGQLAIRLIERKIINPEFLVLIGTPFQFVKSSQIAAAMPKTAYENFKGKFSKAPDETLKKFSILTMMNDKNSRELFENLTITSENHKNLIFWLEELGRFSCHEIDFSSFPKTLIIHGAGDIVVHPSQAEVFAKKIPHAILKIITNCGHAPHYNNADELQKIIQQHLTP